MTGLMFAIDITGAVRISQTVHYHVPCGFMRFRLMQVAILPFMPEPNFWLTAITSHRGVQATAAEALTLFIIQ